MQKKRFLLLTRRSLALVGATFLATGAVASAQGFPIRAYALSTIQEAPKAAESAPETPKHVEPAPEPPKHAEPAPETPKHAEPAPENPKSAEPTPAQKVEEAVKDAKEHVETAAQEAKEKVRETAEAAKEKVETAIETAKEHAAETARAAREGLEEAIQAVATDADAAAQGAKKQAKAAVEAAKADVEEAAKNAKEKTEIAAELAKEQLAVVAEEGREQAKAVADAAKRAFEAAKTPVKPRMYNYNASTLSCVMQCPECAVFSRAIHDSGLEELIGGARRVTIFAPTDEAFARWPRESLEQLFDCKPALAALVLNHVCPESLSPAELTKLQRLACCCNYESCVKFCGKKRADELARHCDAIADKTKDRQKVCDQNGGVGLGDGALCAAASFPAPVVRCVNGYVYPIDRVQVPRGLKVYQALKSQEEQVEADAIEFELVEILIPSDSLQPQTEETKNDEMNKNDDKKDENGAKENDAKAENETAKVDETKAEKAEKAEKTDAKDADDDKDDADEDEDKDDEDDEDDEKEDKDDDKDKK